MNYIIIIIAIHFQFTCSIEFSHKRSTQIKTHKSLFRSYHPHYLQSLSYPQPFTPHFYFGTVKTNTPIFFYSQVE
jgi:hypothetical protein